MKKEPPEGRFSACDNDDKRDRHGDADGGVYEAEAEKTGLFRAVRPEKGMAEHVDDVSQQKHGAAEHERDCEWVATERHVKTKVIKRKCGKTDQERDGVDDSFSHGILLT